MAYVFKLPPTVTDQIMRFTVGYPRDRINQMMARVERIECKDDSDPERIQKYVKWIELRGPSRNCEILLMQKRLFPESIDDWIHGLFIARAMVRAQQQCDACEPVELALQRTQF